MGSCYSRRVGERTMAGWYRALCPCVEDSELMSARAAYIAGVWLYPRTRVLALSWGRFARVLTYVKLIPSTLTEHARMANTEGTLDSLASTFRQDSPMRPSRLPTDRHSFASSCGLNCPIHAALRSSGLRWSTGVRPRNFARLAQLIRPGDVQL